MINHGLLFLVPYPCNESSPIYGLLIEAVGDAVLLDKNWIAPQWKWL